MKMSLEWYERNLKNKKAYRDDIAVGITKLHWKLEHLNGEIFMLEQQIEEAKRQAGTELALTLMAMEGTDEDAD